MSSLFGYVQGFSRHGPAYRDYVDQVEEFARMILLEPWRGQPYPEQRPDRNMDLDLSLFLAAHDHPTFRLADSGTLQAGLPPHSLVWLDGQKQSQPLVISSSKPGIKRLVIDFPPADEVRALRGVHGTHQFVMHRVHPDYLAHLGAPPHTHFYVADLMSHDLSPDVTPVLVSRMPH